MKTKLIALALGAFCCCVASARSSMVMTSKDQSCDKWIERHFSKGTTPPFSFNYDGVSSDLLLKKWTFSKSAPVALENGETQRSFFWTDKGTGLRVECRVKTFNDFNAMEWTLYFKNQSSGNSGQISDVKAADIDLESRREGDWSLFYARGSDAGKHDFMAQTKEYSVGDSLVMIPNLGRSSSVSFPYFNVKTPEGGMVFAIGWTGSWKAEIIRPEQDCFRVSTGLKNLNTYLSVSYTHLRAHET